MIKQLGAALETMLADGTPPIHLLADSTQQGTPSIGLGSSNKALQVLRQPAFGWATHYGQGANRTSSMLGTLIAQLLGVRYRAFSTQAEALAFLYDQDDTLPPAP